SLPASVCVSGVGTRACWHPDAAVSAARRNSASFAVRSKRKGQSRKDELSRIISRLYRIAGEEYAIPQRQRYVAVYAPVGEEVRLPAEIALVAGRLVDRRVFPKFVEQEQIAADLKPPQCRDVRRRESGDSHPNQQKV